MAMQCSWPQTGGTLTISIVAQLQPVARHRASNPILTASGMPFTAAAILPILLTMRPDRTGRTHGTECRDGNRSGGILA